MDSSSIIDYAEGRVFKFEEERSIQPSFLETFDYAGPRQRVSYQMNAFAAVFHFSGLPDTGIVWVDYIPSQKLLELKALKYYFQTFRNEGIFQEDRKLWHYITPIENKENFIGIRDIIGLDIKIMD